jgi:hypothetical protein
MVWRGARDLSQAVRIVIATKPMDFRKAMMGWLHWPNVNWTLTRTPASLLCSAQNVATGSRCCFGTGPVLFFAPSGWNRASSLGRKFRTGLCDCLRGSLKHCLRAWIGVVLWRGGRTDQVRQSVSARGHDVQAWVHFGRDYPCLTASKTLI